MSKKRTRNTNDDSEPNMEDILPPKIADSPHRKKRKLTHTSGLSEQEQKEISIDIDKENNSNTNNNNKPTKKDKKSAKDSKTEMTRLKSKHRTLLSEGYKCIAGVDEAGRGPLAGPVVVAAAYVPIDICIDGITDSKKINDESEREKLYEIITSTKEIHYSVSVLDHNTIDEYNILESSMMGMRECVTKLHKSLVKDGLDGIDYALVDGNRNPRFDFPKSLKYEYIIKGDGNIYCIGAASIIAKVTRDRIMIEFDKKYPKYKLAQNKGYPTPFHKRCVWDYGPCDIHRKTFKPVKDWYKANKPEIIKKVEALKKQRAEERKKKWKELDQLKEELKSGKSKEVKKQLSITSFFGKKKKSKVGKRKKCVKHEQKELEIDDK